MKIEYAPSPVNTLGDTPRIRVSTAHPIRNFPNAANPKLMQRVERSKGAPVSLTSQRSYPRLYSSRYRFY